MKSVHPLFCILALVGPIVFPWAFAGNDSLRTFDLNTYIPLETGKYWALSGQLNNDSESVRMVMRQEVESTVYVKGRPTQRLTKQIVPSLTELSEGVGVVNEIEYLSVGNGLQYHRNEGAETAVEHVKPAQVLPQQVELGASYKHKSYVTTSDDLYGEISYHTAVLGIVQLELKNGSFPVLKINQEKRIKLASDDRLKEVVSTETEYISSYYLESVGLVRQEYMSTSIGTSESQSTSYIADLIATDSLPNYLWPHASTTQDGWEFVDWFGYLTDHYFPWIYHSDHGWLFVDAEDTSDVRLWSESMGWLFTSVEMYPALFSHDLGDWLMYQLDGSSVERTFLREDGRVLTVSNAGFRFASNQSKPPTPETSADREKAERQVFVDEDGNRYTNKEGQGIDVDPGDLPTVEILYPHEGKEVNPGDRVLLLADAKDKDGVIKWVKFYVNGALIGLSEKAPYQTMIVMDNTTETYEIVARASDNYNNVTDSEPVTIRSKVVEPKDPKVRVASPMNRTHYALGRRVYVELKASDADGRVEEVGLYVDGIQVGDSKRSAPYKFDFIPPEMGDYKISGFAIDDDGQESNATEITIVVNATGVPSDNEGDLEVRIVEPLNSERFEVGEGIPITVTATDGAYSVNRLRVFVNDQQFGNSVKGNYLETTYYPPASFAGTPVTIRAEARNEAYETESVDITVRINP